MNEAKEFVDLVARAIEKGVLDSTQLEGAGIPMRARGEYQRGERYERGDVVNVRGVGLFIAKQSNTANPTAAGSDNWLTVSAYGSGGGVAGAAATSFTTLLDTPNVYTGAAGQAVRVNLTATALEFYTPAAQAIVQATPPAAPVVGQLWYVTSVNQMAMWRGAAWVAI